MPFDPLAERLARLLADGCLPASSLGRRQRDALRPLFDARVLEERRVGAGRRVEVADQAALEAFVRKYFPSGLSPELGRSLPPRATAVAQRRDAKRVPTTDAEPVLLKGFGDAEVCGPKGVLPVAAWTRQAGVAALILGEGGSWSGSGEVAVVENLEVFLHLEALELGCDLALYAGGRLSRRVLAWLGSAAMAGCRYLHLGDYDPVGLDEYLRLAQACPGRARLFVPEDLQDLLTAFGKPDLLEASPAVLARLRASADPAVRRVISILDRCGLGLEQEVLLVRRR